MTIAAVTSCTNTSDLSLLVAAALLASPPLAVAYAIAGRAAPGIGQDLLGATREVSLIQAGGMPRPSCAVPWPPTVIAAGGKRLPTCCPGAAGMAGKGEARSLLRRLNGPQGPDVRGFYATLRLKRQSVIRCATPHFKGAGEQLYRGGHNTTRPRYFPLAETSYERQKHCWP
ncbi:hypothetical protein [Pseudoroseomonas ludipueritiae]|uniref:Uncharacterized protein n=1 Tax=Pseudoroseomonas ludipueritiae TaxID=198093 RepID=A0ABR7R1U2_9PROT|nr:hypothetical protein [Pseudoroseomonas ludipueritiae]MBC9175705.1 hypothetical protein [Pseudoroseomonas ludipueritiae]